MADMTTTRDDRPTAIDPPGCGCTECITGMYVPLDQATPRMIVAMCLGWISNHTSQEPATLLAAAVPAEMLAKVLIDTTLEWQQDYVMRELVA